MKVSRNVGRSFLNGWVGLVGVCSMISVLGAASADEAALRERIATLEAELSEARLALAEMEASEVSVEVEDLGSGIKVESPQGGSLKIGGAVRVNYVLGDYPGGGDGPSRGGHGGDFELDTFRVNLDYGNGPWLAKAEYRFYTGYNFLHTGWIGYQWDEYNQLEVGLTRVPFGAGPYGVSQSWFFDQHYYVGLADDMDLGVKYSMKRGDWAFDFAYFLDGGRSWRGATQDSARYSYDVVNEDGMGFEERDQVNFRAIRSWEWGKDLSGAFGASLQFGELRAGGLQADGDQWAASLHAITDYGPWKLGTQLSYYELDGVGLETTFGAYDFPVSTASRAWVPAVSLSYLVETKGVEWLDTLRPYIEYSNVIKPEVGFNDSAFLTFGTAFSRGAWYVYLDYVLSNGNEFVGGEVPYGERMGRNPYDEWQKRMNLNLGLYF